MPLKIMFIWFGHVLPVLCLGNSYEMYASKQSQPTRSQERVVRPGLPYPMGSRKACFIEGERLPWRCAFSLCCPRPMFETKQFCDSATHPKISSQTRAPSQTPISGLGFKHIHIQPCAPTSTHSAAHHETAFLQQDAPGHPRCCPLCVPGRLRCCPRVRISQCSEHL